VGVSVGKRFSWMTEIDPSFQGIWRKEGFCEHWNEESG
jgi:hypothetical protein